MYSLTSWQGDFINRRILARILILFYFYRSCVPAKDFQKRERLYFANYLKRCIDKRRNMTRFGAAASFCPKCKFFDVMRFLYDRVSNKPSESSLPSTCTRVNMDDKPISLCSSPSLSSCSAPSPLTPGAIGAPTSMKRDFPKSFQSTSSIPIPKKQKPDIQKMNEQFVTAMKTMNDDLIASMSHSGETQEICKDKCTAKA